MHSTLDEITKWWFLNEYKKHYIVFLILTFIHFETIGLKKRHISQISKIQDIQDDA